MLPEDKYFDGDLTKAWERYCGFLDLSTGEFMEIQKHLLLEQLELITDTPVGRQFMSHGGRTVKPSSVDEFRKLVPLTTYENYAPLIGNRQDDAIGQKAAYWSHTSGRGGSFKWIPYTERADEVFVRNLIGAVTLGLANRHGEVNLRPGIKVLSNIPERPYISGVLAFSIAKRFTWQSIPPLEISESLEFQERIAKGFKMALRDRVDLVISLSSVLIKIGDSFCEGTRRMKFAPFMLHPRILTRLALAMWQCKREKRCLMPKDLWPVKGVVSWGTDLGIFKDKIRDCWGKEPYEFYAFAEAGFVAMQSWTKKGMTFLPHSAFLEFIPQAEWLKWRDDNSYQPSTVLLDEVKSGESYEIVITSFYGMPFLRYRVGDLLKIVSLKDEEAGIDLPQAVFQSRADDIIDIASFTRLDEKTIWQAIANTGIKHADWTALKETDSNQSFLRIYIELKESLSAGQVTDFIHDQMKALDHDYRDLEKLIGVKPIRVTLLAKGAFDRYYQSKRAAGYDLAHLKPPHINPPPDTIKELLQEN